MDAGAATGRGPAADEHEAKLVAGLRAGDEQAFCDLFDRYYGSLVSVARRYTATREAAEDAVQETFTAVVDGIDRFEGRSSLKTWLFRILINRAITRGEKESRTQPFSAVVRSEDDPIVDPDRFYGTEHRWAGFWSAPPSANFPEERVLGGELREVVRSIVADLPPQQGLVLSLRDVEGMDSDEVCELLGISEGNQRVLLHRARAKCRTALERHGDLLSGVIR
ncbi:MAG TPA: sigma-70 family RNA polymerase sigma factor [Acidimicrobiia bacterium]